MKSKTISNIKLGLFVVAGLAILILLLYTIGKNQNLFGSNFELRARFGNVQGLTQGNNIRYSGIQVGTVKRIIIINDTTIEVVMLIKSSIRKYIGKNAIASIGTDGLVGNKLVNISPAAISSAPVEDGDILAVKETIDTDEMLQTLAKTNNNIAFITAELKNTVQRINNSIAIWDLLNDQGLPRDIRQSLVNIKTATARAAEVTKGLEAMVTDVRDGKGTLGTLLTDTTIAFNLNQAVLQAKAVGDEASKLADELNTTVRNIRYEVDHGKGPVNALLKDSTMVAGIHTSLENIQKGTDGFNDVIEALKHNFLLRGYFRKLEKQRQKDAKQSITVQ